MSKQDRQGVRTASELERKYNFTKNFSEAQRYAKDAQRSADAAQTAVGHAFDAVTELNRKFTYEELFKILTNDTGVLSALGFVVRSNEENAPELVEVKLQEADGKTYTMISIKSPSGVSALLLIADESGTSLEVDKINGKRVSWKENGDGTYSLIGTD